TYSIIKNGEWLSYEKYGTVHRVASNGKSKGIFNEIITFCESKISHLRIDTHKDNKIMQHLIEKNGFHKCGIIYVADGTSRLAYEKI
ncbi:MAG: N-acetyltransferase, partial [Pseudoleptotrichia goodfellowii]|nr:N-acetyltransferase [Pseudoleptotrichia goodfellowii]